MTATKKNLERAAYIVAHYSKSKADIEILARHLDEHDRRSEIHMIQIPEPIKKEVRIVACTRVNVSSCSE